MLVIFLHSVDTVSMLTVYLRKNPFSNRRKPYVWHAKSAGRITHEKLIEAVARANTTVTRADVLAVISEYERQFLLALQEGFSVESFFGTLCAGATGSAEKESERFRPDKPKDRRTSPKDHKLTLNFKAKPLFLQKVKDGLRYRTERLQNVCEPQISFVANAAMQTGTSFRAGGIIHIRGQFLKINPADEEQGVFLVKAGTEYRFHRYSRCTRCGIDSLLPDGVSPGDYLLEVRTRKSRSLHVSNVVSVSVAQEG